MALNAPYTSNTVIQSTQVSNDLVGLANGTNDTTNNSMSTFRGDVIYDHVVPNGCVWSGDSYAATRNASQTVGTVYISGVRLPVAAVSARSFTASKDTYIDINGSGVQVYTEVTNNAASPALTAGNLRIGIIITGATTIAAAASVNQGQEDRILPIASSVAYSVTDSIGNLICPRDPTRKLIGYRQVIANGGAIAVDTAIAGLVCAFIPTIGRKIVVKGYFANGSGSTAGDLLQLTIKNNASTIVQIGWSSVAPTTGSAGTVNADYVNTPTATPQTFSINYQRGGGTGTVAYLASATQPAFIRVEHQ